MEEYENFIYGIDKEIKEQEYSIKKKENEIFIEKNKINKNLPVIYHMADIHITNKNERYEEYQEIFEKVYKLLENDPREKIIAICGDLYDNKITFKTNTLKFVSKFIARLSKYGEVILINGNHDLSMINETIESTIESMLTLPEELDKNLIKNIHYLNDNKIYKIKGINFGLTTMFSNKITIIPNKKFNELYIGLFHGKVYGAKTDLRYSVSESESNFRTTDFKEYDIVLLGDIHQHQFLDDKKRIAYPSSLVQKNYGETVKSHGLIIWDLNELKGEFVEIPNDYCMCKCICKCILDKEEEIIPNENINLSDYKFINVQIEYEKDKILDKYSLEERLKKKYPNIKSLTLYEKININLFVDEETNTKSDKDKNIKEEINEYIDKTSNTEENKKEMKEILLNIINENKYDKEQEMKKIELIEMEFENLFCYGSNNKIDFSKLKKINGINGENGYGKSSIIDILLYCLYQKVGKGAKIKVLNKFKKRANIKLMFRVNDELYLIHREIKPENKKQSEFKDHLDIIKILKNQENELIGIKYDAKVINELVKEKKVILLNGSDKKNSNSIISEIFGSYEDLIDNNIMLQNSVSFISKGDEEKKTILFSIFGLKPYKELYKTIHTKLNCIKSSLTMEEKNLMTDETKQVNTKNINEIEIKIKAKLEELDKMIKIIEEQNYNEKKIKEILGEKIEIEELDEKIRNLEKRENQNINCINDLLKKINETEINLEYIYEKIDEERVDLKNKYENIITYKNKIKTFDEIKNIDKKIMKMNENKEKIELMKKECDEINKDKSNLTLNEINNELLELKNILIEYESSKKILSEYKKENKFLLEHEFNDKCDKCIQNKLIHDKINYINKINELNEFIIRNNLISYTIKKKEDDKNNIIRFNELNEKIKMTEKENKSIEELINIDNKNQENRQNNIIIQDKIKILEEEYNHKEQKYNEKMSYYNLLKKNIDIKNIIYVELNKLKNVKIKYEENLEIILNLKDKIKDKDINIKIKNDIEKEIKNLEKNKIIIETELDLDKKLKNKLNKINEEKNKYDRILKLFTVDKLLDNKIKNIVTNIESIVNNILKDLTDFTIKLHVDIDKVLIYKNKDEELIDAKGLSGYEIFITNLALRIAFCKLNKFVRSNFLIIDEGFTASSQNNLPKMESLFDTIRKYFKWSIIVSHLDQIKSNYDYTHSIKKIKCGKTSDSVIFI